MGFAEGERLNGCCAILSGIRCCNWDCSRKLFFFTLSLFFFFPLLCISRLVNYFFMRCLASQIRSG